MRVFVQIPCLNEEATLAEVIREIPRVIDGVDELKVIVVDDGSRDRTAQVAWQGGADYVVRHHSTQGLAKAFALGMATCLELGADIIVNTDGDHQYRGEDIPRLIQPILDGRAEIAIGDRRVARVAHFSPLKRALQVVGSKIVSALSHVALSDVTCGFRAYSREAALRLNVFSSFSYTLETLFLAGSQRLSVTKVPIVPNRPRRPSRLFSNLGTYLKKSTATIVRAYALYEPLRTFFYIGGVLGGVGVLGVIRFLYYYALGDGAGHIQSLLLSGVLLVVGVQAWMLGILADLISINRRLGEDILYHVRRNGTRRVRGRRMMAAGSRRRAPPEVRESVTAVRR
jgi:glycosyltransferase involved in cell wall biosynthesis